MSKPLPVLICGARGRMGKTLVDLAESENAVVVAACDEGDSVEKGIEGCRAAIDFSHHSATAGLAVLCADRNIPLVIGTTGHTQDERDRILAVAERIPVVWSGNYSIGVNLLYHLTALSSRVLGNRYNPEIMEIHHRHKKDAPSGTAVNLAEAIETAEAFREARRVNGREGETGERVADEIGLHALRGGEVVGEHTVFLFGEHDRLELTHRAGDRRIFASGAYRAAHWATGQSPGLYSMGDVLGFSTTGAATS